MIGNKRYEAQQIMSFYHLNYFEMFQYHVIFDSLIYEIYKTEMQLFYQLLVKRKTNKKP